MANENNQEKLCEKYSWFENHEEIFGYTVKHTDNDVETIIALTDSAEKADIIAKGCNVIHDAEVTQRLLVLDARHKVSAILTACLRYLDSDEWKYLINELQSRLPEPFQEENKLRSVEEIKAAISTVNSNSSLTYSYKEDVTEVLNWVLGAAEFDGLNND